MEIIFFFKCWKVEQAKFKKLLQFLSQYFYESLNIDSIFNYNRFIMRLLKIKNTFKSVSIYDKVHNK